MMFKHVVLVVTLMEDKHSEIFSNCSLKGGKPWYWQSKRVETINPLIQNKNIFETVKCEGSYLTCLM